MPTYGPWMDDATTVETLMLDKNTRAGVDTWGWGWTGAGSSISDMEGALLDVWTNGTLSHPAAGGLQTAQLDVGHGPGQTTSEAGLQAVWLTCEKPASYEVTGSTPPPGYDSTPGVIGVEWEPTSAVESQRLEVTAYDVTIGAFDGRPFHVKMVDDTGPRYEPPAETGPTMSLRADVATVTTARSGDAETGTVSIASPPVTVDPGGAKFAVALLDDLTQLQDTSGATSLFEAGGSFYSTRVRLYYTQRPRYRLVYADVPVSATPVSTRVTPSLRMLQRGGQGGMSGIPRMVGDPTRRGIRQGPGSIY